MGKSWETTINGGLNGKNPGFLSTKRENPRRMATFLWENQGKS
jgi:hypothetical protein